jgi:hypothetical protein
MGVQRVSGVCACARVQGWADFLAAHVTWQMCCTQRHMHNQPSTPHHATPITTVLSVTLALGAYQLAKAGAIVARMSAVEEMAGVGLPLAWPCAGARGAGACVCSSLAHTHTALCESCSRVTAAHLANTRCHPTCHLVCRHGHPVQRQDGHAHTQSAVH